MGKIGELIFYLIFVIPAPNDICMDRETRYAIKKYLGFLLIFLTAAVVFAYALAYFPVTIWPLTSLIIMISPFVFMISFGQLGSKRRLQDDNVIHIKEV